MDDAERQAMQASCAAWLLAAERAQDDHLDAVTVQQLRQVWEAAWSAGRAYEGPPHEWPAPDADDRDPFGGTTDIQAKLGYGPDL